MRRVSAKPWRMVAPVELVHLGHGKSSGNARCAGSGLHTNRVITGLAVRQDVRVSKTESNDGDDAATSTAVNVAVPAIVAAGAGLGVLNAFWFLALHGYPVIWLVTATDAEKAEVAKRGLLRAEVLAALREAGVQSDLVEQTHITVESQETVDRDYEGSWYYAMK